MFQQPTPQTGSKLAARSELCSSFPSSLSSRVRVSSTSSTGAATGSGGSLVAPGTNASFATQLMQRAMPAISQDQIRNALPLIGNGAYLALASGFLMTDMLQLRLMLVGGYAGLVTFHSLHARPLQIPLRWSALFVVVNAGAAMLLFIDEWIGALLSEEELALYEQHFKDGLTPGQFYYLLQMATTKEVEDGTTLTKEGCVSPNLYFIEKGQAKVYHRGTFAAYIDEGGFVNDVAFQQTEECHDSDNEGRINRSNSGDSGDDEIETYSALPNGNRQQQDTGIGAYGTVVTTGDCKVWVWNQTELKQYLEKRPAMDRNMRYTLSQHLVRSLLEQREVRRHAGTEEQDDLEKTKVTMPERRQFRQIKTKHWSSSGGMSGTNMRTAHSASAAY